MVKVKVLEGTPVSWGGDDANVGGIQVMDEAGNVVEAGDEVDLDTGLAQVLYSQGYVDDVDGVLVGVEVPEAEEVEVPTAEEVEVPTAEEVGVTRPNISANKDEWSDYVEALGGDPAGKTKGELIDEADALEEEE